MIAGRRRGGAAPYTSAQRAVLRVLIVLLVALVGFLCGVALSLGCGGSPSTTLQQDLGVVAEPQWSEQPEEPLSGAPGNLPLGYYGLQCQWDACGGPKDVGQQEFTNPVR